MITAIVLINADKDAIGDLGEKLAAVEGVSEVYSVTGEIDFVAVIRARKHEELADIVTKGIIHLPGVSKTHTHVAFKAYSRHDLESIFAIGGS